MCNFATNFYVYKEITEIKSGADDKFPGILQAFKCGILYKMRQLAEQNCKNSCWSLKGYWIFKNFNS